MPCDVSKRSVAGTVPSSATMEPSTAPDARTDSTDGDGAGCNSGETASASTTIAIRMRRRYTNVRQSAHEIMTASEFRRMAVSMPGAVEGAHMGHADFRAGGKKIFATLNAEETRGMVSLTPEQQAEFLLSHPAMFAPASGAWGLNGATMVELAHADPEVVGEAMTLAWQAKQAATGKPKPPRRSAKASRDGGRRSAKASRSSVKKKR